MDSKDQEKESFDEAFRAAISASLRETGADEALRQRLLERLGQEQISTRSLPQGVAEPALSEFEARLCQTTQQALAGQAVPESLKGRVLDALKAESQSEAAADQVVPMGAWGRRWKKVTGWGLSLAAGFAIVFVLFFSGAEAAIANDIQRDHEHCAGAVTVESTPDLTFDEQLAHIFGEVPPPPVGGDWKLKANNICPTSRGVQMVHYVYARTNPSGKVETLSLHFIPPAADSRNMKVGKPRKLRQIEGEFAILGWTQGYWTCTVCSPDVDVATLRQAVAGLGIN